MARAATPTLRRAAARHRRGLRQADRDRGPARRRLAAAGLRAGADDGRRGAGDGARGRRDHGRHARARAADAVRRAARPGRWPRSCAGPASGSSPAPWRAAPATASCWSPAASGSTSSASSPCRASSGRRSTGLACDEEGFILARDDGRVRGARRTWAAGDGIASPVKFGGVATHQARIAAAGIAREAGVDAPDPGEPVAARPAAGRPAHPPPARPRRREGAPLWWPHGKVAGEYLPRWLAENGIASAASAEPPAGEGITVGARCVPCARPSTSTCSSSGASTGRASPRHRARRPRPAPRPAGCGGCP